MATKTIYELATGTPIFVQDAVDAKECVATGRYSYTEPPSLPLDLPLPAVTAEQPTAATVHVEPKRGK